MKIRTWPLAIICLICSVLPLDLLAVQAPNPQETDTAPIRQIGVYVDPYYRSAVTPDGHPEVNVSSLYDTLLASNKKADILAVEAQVQSKPEAVSPMTLMVLAIRMYDVGLRDRGVFWFYVAKDRYVTLIKVIDINGPGLEGVDDAVRNFASLAGPFLNSYAFCDPAKQYQLSQDALDWVEKNPYQAIYMDQLTARPGDRKANLDEAIELLHHSLAREHAQVTDPAKLAQMRSTRKAKHVDEQFCWKN